MKKKKEQGIHDGEQRKDNIKQRNIEIKRLFQEKKGTL